MHTIVSLSRWTELGASTLKSHSFQISRDGIEDAGIRIKHAFWAPVGRFDTVLISEADSLDAVARSKAWMNKRFTARTETLVVQPISETPLDPSLQTFVSLGTWTQKGAQEWKGAETVEEVRQRLALQDVHLRSLYWVLSGGPFDTVTLSQAPSLEAFTTARMMTVLGGRSRTETLLVLPPKDFAAAHLRAAPPREG